MVPNGWELVSAQDVCKSISVGVVIKPTQYYVEKSEGVKAFRSANVREGFINDNDWVYFSPEGHAANKKSQLQAGDVLIVRTGYPGTACVVTREFEGSNAIDIVIARPDINLVIPEYLCAYTNSHIGKSQVLDLQGGMAQKHLNVGAYQVLKIKLPPLPEQKKIAQILSTWDKAITTTEQLLSNSKQQKKALMQQLLTGKKRLLDKNGVRFDGEWKKIAIGKMIKEVKKVKEENPNSIELLTVKLHYKGVTRTGKFPNATERGRPYFKRFSGELIIGRQNLHNGGVAIVSDECNGLIASNAISSFEARKGVDLNYVLSIMSTDHFRFSINNLAGGTGQKEIGVNDLLSLSLVVPDFAEQQKIAAVLSSADQEIAALQQKLDALKKEKKALMQQLLTGKRLVKVN